LFDSKEEQGVYGIGIAIEINGDERRNWDQ
jgi:hypothetical protein